MCELRSMTSGIDVSECTHNHDRGLMFGGTIRPTVVSSFLSLKFISRLFFILKYHPIYSRLWTCFLRAIVQGTWHIRVPFYTTNIFIITIYKRHLTDSEGRRKLIGAVLNVSVEEVLPVAQ